MARNTAYLLEGQMPRAQSAYVVALRVAILYACAGALWIALSDWALSSLVRDVALLAEIQTWKGWAFITTTAALLFVVLLRRELRIHRSMEALQASEQRFRSLFEKVGSVAVQGYLSSREVIYWNHASEVLYGYSASEAMGNKLEDLIIPAPMRENVVGEVSRWVELGEAIPAGELRLRRKDGSEVPVFSSHVMIENTCGEQEMYCLDIDLSALKQAQTKLRLSEAVFNDTSEAIIVTDADNRILSVNKAFVRITGYPAEEVVGENPRMLSSGRHDYAFFANMWNAILNDGQWRGEILNRRKGGEVFPVWLAISAVKDEAGGLLHFVAIMSDLSEKRAIEQRLQYIANHDELTHLPNLVLLRDRASQAFTYASRDGQRVALAVLDLDHFKLINESLGHTAGDLILRATVTRVFSCLSYRDTLCRQGGDELLILFTEFASADEVARVLQGVVDQVAQPMDIGGKSIVTSASIGVAFFPDDAEEFEDLMLKAETAMYHAKRAGRNCLYFFAERMNQDVREHFAMQSRLAMALDRNELFLHYQPQFNLVSGTVVGAEALLRWNDSLEGMVPPDKFIPLAESSGLIIPIGQWVLQEACRQAQCWRAEGAENFTIAVNMSVLQFRRSDPVETIAQVLRETGLPAYCLELELTESFLVEDANAMLDAMGRLKDLGVSLAIDDFGTGYSSLAYLKRYPIDKLKIDRSFVNDIGGDDGEAASIVQTIIRLGTTLKMKTLAEGVETDAQLAFLREEGCCEAQGYLVGRPMEARRFAELFLPSAVSGAGSSAHQA